MTIMHNDIKYIPQTLSDSGNDGVRFVKLLISRFCACAVKIYLKLS